MNDDLKENIKGEIISLLYIIFVFILAIPFYKIKPEYSRKVIHIMLGNFYFIALFYFTEWYFAFLGPFVFIFINLYSVRYRKLKLMLRHDDKTNILPKDKYDYGTVYYAISLTILTSYSWKIRKPDLGLCPFLSMAFGDGLACILGRNIPSPYKILFGAKKSLVGSMTMLSVSSILFYFYFCYYNVNLLIIKSIFIGFSSMIFEAFSPYGTDNIFVPLGNFILVLFLI